MYPTVKPLDFPTNLTVGSTITADEWAATIPTGDGKRRATMIEALRDALERRREQTSKLDSGAAELVDTYTLTVERRLTMTGGVSVGGTHDFPVERWVWTSTRTAAEYLERFGS